MASSGRVPQGEVIMDFADGGSYIKNKLEDSALNLERRKITREEGAKATKALESLDVKPVEEVKGADVDLIVKELGVSKDDAQAALRAAKGDVVKALVQLTAPGRR